MNNLQKSSKDTGEKLSDNLETLMQDQEDKVVEGLFQSLLSRYKMSGKHWWKVAILSLIVFIYYITKVLK